MLQTSKDLFWIVLSFVILWIGIFGGWCVYYLARILRDTQKITGNIKRKFDLLDQILKSFKTKTEKTAAYIPLVIDGVEKIAQHFKNQKTRKNTQNKGKNKL